MIFLNSSRVIKPVSRVIFVLGHIIQSKLQKFVTSKIISSGLDRFLGFLVIKSLTETTRLNSFFISNVLRCNHMLCTFNKLKLEITYKIKYFEFRPPRLDLENLIVLKDDLKNLSLDNNSIKSLSCMHVVEHIGLGRYGDEMDYDGDLKAIGELIRVLARDGNLLFVIPIGQPKIVFNAHRIYSYEQIMDYFTRLNLVEFTPGLSTNPINS